MTAEATCVSLEVGRAPWAVDLRGDKARKPEAVEHLLNFPGGYVGVCRVPAEGGGFEYWAHIGINRGQMIAGAEGFAGAAGRAVDARIDYGRRAALGPTDIPDFAEIDHIAVRIATGALG